MKYYVEYEENGINESSGFFDSIDEAEKWTVENDIIDYRIVKQ